MIPIVLSNEFESRHLLSHGHEEALLNVQLLKILVLET